jgi:hypothetical protein
VARILEVSMVVPRLARARRRERGLSLLMATVVVTLVTMTVLLSLTLVGRESELQRHQRVRRQAFFAAEAGLAEGRQALSLLLGNNTTYSAVFQRLAQLRNGPAHTREPGLGSAQQPWFDVLDADPAAPAQDPWQYYSLTVGSTLRDEDLIGFNAYPTWTGVRYRVFLLDDDDDADPTQDINTRVWLVAIGEVPNPEGVPTRAVVRALITNSNTLGTMSPGTIDRGGMYKNNDTSLDVEAPTISNLTTL